jgi:DNA polymerase-3 subunit alpha
MPDIDIDFCMNRRGEVIDYVTRKYGRENVAQIITFGTMAAKAAIKDVGRAMDVPYNDVDRIAKMVPTTLNNQAGDRNQRISCLAASLRERRPGQQLIDTAMKLEGLVRNAGVHAAGVVISPRPLNELGSALQDQERRNCHRLRHGRYREDGPVEDGLPRPDHAYDS